MSRWLDFAAIRRAVPIEAVLRRYEWTWVRRRGDRVQGRCPLHGGLREDAFHADLAGNGFHCFACGLSGSVLDLVAALEQCSTREAALSLSLWFSTGAAPTGPGSAGQGQRIRKKEPLDALPFSLRPVLPAHPYFRQRGIRLETAVHFGAGHYPGPGMMHDRVVIPVHDHRSRLLAYAGRALDSRPPKYLLPAGFPKSQVLFNLHRADLSTQTLVVVEGYFDCMKVHQAGFPNVVALMGSSLSIRQRELLQAHARRVILMLDADQAGLRATHIITTQLGEALSVALASPPLGMQTDQLSSDNISRILSGALAPRSTHRKE